jgi:uncharacterized membrane protein (Fun14 family)
MRYIQRVFKYFKAFAINRRNANVAFIPAKQLGVVALCRYSNWICFEESDKDSSRNSWIISSWIAYLQYYRIANINWNKLQQISEDAIKTLSNVIMQIPDISSGSDVHTATTSSLLTMTIFGIPLSGSMSAGFTFGFLKG